MAAIDEVLTWATTLPSWQGDAVRRLFQAGDNPLDTKDYADVVALAKADLKLAVAPPGLVPVPPTLGMFSGAPAATVSIKLISIDNVQNVNIIKSGQSQPFGETGVTVVYGDNGAGKSGYARILKLACQARDKEDLVLPNVFAAGKVGIPSATLKVKGAAGLKDVVWTQGAPSDSILTNITVFDSRCARLITDKRNQITYLPYGCDVIPKLASLVSQIKDGLTAEIKELIAIQDAAVTEGTPSAAFLLSLSADTKKEAIDGATAWSPEDEAELVSQQELVTKSTAESAAGEIAKLTKVKGRIVEAVEAVVNLTSKCTPITNAVIENSLTELNAAKSAHALAVAERQKPEPLSGVGSTNEWQILYRAAKDYSEKVAYVGQPFPKTDDAVCVLCQQTLQAEAVARFARFKMFMEDATSATLTTKRTALAAVRTKLDEIKPLSGAALGAVCDEVATYGDEAGAAFRAYHEGIDTRKLAALALLEEGKSPDKAHELQDWPQSPVEKLNTIVTTLEGKIATIAAASKPDEHKALTVKLTNLKARKALSIRKSEIEQYVETIKRNAALTHAANSLRTQEITRQGTAIIKKTLTPELLKSLEDELKELGAIRVPVSVKPVGGDGETTHEMLLQGASAIGKNRMSQILSEGEARVVAIAGFLAELKLVPHANAIVFDDPVSSLDHIFTGKIAERLVREGAKRQVIVFTHNIAFLMEVAAAASVLDELGTHVEVTVHTLRRSGADAGVTTSGLPWHAAKVGSRVSYLQMLVAGIKPMYLKNMETYNKEAAHIYGLLRESWEACIEDDLINSAVCRFRNSVETRRLKVVEITDADIGVINGHMSKTSNWMTGHDKSKALHYDRPAPDEILADIEALRQFADAVKKRRSVTAGRR